MSTKAPLNPPAFENAQDEINYWKNLAFDLFKNNGELHQRIDALIPVIDRIFKHLNLEFPTATSAPALKKRKRKSLDPFEFTNLCEDIQENLMQHFKGKDLLVMSEVSKNWNNRVEPGITKKVLLKVEKFRKVQDIEEDLTRKYKHFSSTFNLQSLSTIADTAESLNVNIIENKEPINFTKLTKLQLAVLSDVRDFSWINKIQVEKLEELTIMKLFCDDDDDEHNENCPFCNDAEEILPAQQDFIKFFTNLKSLKHLNFCGCPSAFLFKMDENFVPRWKLETLDVDAILGIPREILRPLKKLRMGFNDEEISIVFEMCKELTSLEILDYDDSPYEQFPSGKLPVRTTIKNLSIQLVSTLDINAEKFNFDVKVVLEAVPELETFFITKLTSGLMRFIAGLNLKLKTVKYSEIEEGTLEQYEKMRQTQPKINRDIQFILKV